MADEDFAPDEWHTPSLNDHLPFPPPLGVDLDVFDSFPPFMFTVYAALWYRGWHEIAPPWFWWAVIVVDTIWIANCAIRPKGRRLFAWLPIVWRYIAMAARTVLANLHAPDISAAVRTDGSFTFILPRSEGRKNLANVFVHDDGIMDTLSSAADHPIVRFVRWLVAAALLREPLVRLVWMSDTGALDLIDAEDREGVWAARLALLARPDHRLSLYMRVRGFPIDELQVAAGELLGVDSPPDFEAWAKTLVRRRLIMAVPAGTRRVLNRRVLALLDPQHGTLMRAGLYGQVLDATEVRAMLTDAWGPDFAPTLGVSPTCLEVETGDNDPPPLGDADEEPSGGNPGVRRLVTYVISGVLDTVYVGWMEPLTGRLFHCDVGMHIDPVRDSFADMVLALKAFWWEHLTFGHNKYDRSTLTARRTMSLIRRRETSVVRFGLYATIPETQVSRAELALKAMVGKGNFHIPTLEPIQARAATEPTGRDPINQRWWTDSQTVAAGWPGTGGIWVPGCTLIGESIRSNEPIGCNLWWEGDEAPIFFTAGRSGSGKTNLQMGFVARHLRPHPDHWLYERPPQVVVAYVKPWDEWAAFCRRFGGKHYSLTNDNWREALTLAPMDSPVVAFNMRGIDVDKRGDFLDAYEPWVARHQRGKRKKFPMIDVVGEAWAMKPEHLQQLALQDARALRLGLMVDTQFIDHLLKSAARDVLRTSASFALMRLKKSERDLLRDVFDIGDVGMQFLAQISQSNTLTGGLAVQKGRCIFEAHGLRTQMQFKRFGYEATLLDQTNPLLVDEDELDNEEDVPDVTTNGRVHVVA